MLATLNASDWDRAKAGLLLQRAGFGGTPDEVDALASLSPVEAAESLLGSSKVPPTDPPSFLQEQAIGEVLKKSGTK